MFIAKCDKNLKSSTIVFSNCFHNFNKTKKKQIVESYVIDKRVYDYKYKYINQSFDVYAFSIISN